MTKKKYKALMLDLDGTTIPNNPKGLPTKKVTEAIHKANELLHVGIVTARPRSMVIDIIDILQLTGPAIINGGARVIDAVSGKILYEQQIPKPLMKELYELLTKKGYKLLTNDGDKEIVEEENYVPINPLSLYITNVDATSADTIINSISHYPDIAIHKIPSFIKGEVWIEINHASATKQHGIFEAAKILKIDTHEIIGVGDGYNDFPLLMACGLKVAMGNAVPELKEIADYVAPTVDEDGVADVINKFIL